MLYAIAQAFGVKMTYFFPKIDFGAKVVRADKRTPFRFEGSAIAYSSLAASFSDRKLEPLLVSIDPVDGTLPSDEFRSHPGEEFYHVLEGTLRIRVGDAVHDLYPGDSIHFTSAVKHRIENPGNNPTSALCALTPPLF